MEPLSEAYVGTVAIWLDPETVPRVEPDNLVYAEGEISKDIFPEDWIRIIRVPEGFIIDASHLDDFDNEDKLTRPLDIHIPDEDEIDTSEIAVGYIKNTMQLKGLESMLRQLYNYELGTNLLQTIHDATNGKLQDEGEADEI